MSQPVALEKWQMRYQGNLEVKAPLGKKPGGGVRKVQKAIRTKKNLYGDLPKYKDVETFNKYKEAKIEAKRAVGKAHSTYLDEV